MRLKDARKLRIGDMAVAWRKKAAVPLRVVDIIAMPLRHTTNGMECVSVKLEDGSWHGYKELRLCPGPGRA